jgi:threonine/homoserine/homoserine lactone efflux protein
MLRVGLGSGRGPALRTTLGIAVGEAVWGFAAPFGVAHLALRYPLVGIGIRWMGGVFLLWLAFGALRSAWRGEGEEPAPKTTAEGGFWAGLALMLLNAKAGFFWVSLTGVLLGTDLAPATVVLAVGVAVLLSLAWHTALALAFSGRHLARLYARAKRGIEGVLGAVLAGLGVRLLVAS